MTTTTETPTTADVLVSMLTENTGIHMLDSGRENGRHWQKNQGRDFAAEPATTLEWETGEWGGPMVTHSVYHFLYNTLDFDPEMDALFTEFANLPENEDEHWLPLMEEFPAWVAPRLGHVTAEHGTVNTYNGEDAVSQVLQYTRFAFDSSEWVFGDHVLLQIHGGADVRGGYSRPRAFLTADYPDLFSNADAHILCDGDEHHGWYTDDSYNWYPMGDESPSSLRISQRLYRDEVAAEVVEGTEHVPGKVVVTPDGVGLCPICGGNLAATF